MKKARRFSRNIVTMHDVAKHAGVSPMTVSRVLSGSAKVSAETRNRVKAAVQQLRYTPNLAARNLASATSVHIGLLYNNPSAAYLNQFLLGVLEQSRQSGCQIVLEECKSRNERVVIQKLIDDGAEGIILPPPLSDSKVVVECLRAANVPFIAVATGKPRGVGLSVSINDAEAAATMTRYLVSLGHRRLGFILGASNQRASRERYTGFLLGLKEAGLSTRPEWVRRGSFDYRSGLIAAEKMLRMANRPSAIFASNDDMAAGAISAAHKLRLDVPAELAIVGFDDTPLATAVWPSLTTIRQPVTAMARRALDLLLKEIQMRRKGVTLAPLHLVSKYTLIKRKSSGQFKPGS